MGEAWFMSDERKLYPALLGNLDEIDDQAIIEPLTEAAVGPSNFGPMQEWTEWFHYLLPRMLQRDWKRLIVHPVELVVTGFVTQHPSSSGPFPYDGFRSDALASLGQYIMSHDFWRVGQMEVPACLHKWEGPTGIQGWDVTDGLLSASLMFCTKYLEEYQIAPWFRSALAIENPFWLAQMTTWMIGAYPLLANEIHQPSELSEELHFSAHWDWDHTLNGDYTGSGGHPVQRIKFLPDDNRRVLFQTIGSIDFGSFFDQLRTDALLEKVRIETAGIEDRFLELYGT